MQAQGEQGDSSRSGQLVILAGVATFLIGSFMPFYRVPGSTNETVSLARQMLSGPFDGAGWVLGGILLLFAAAAVVVVAASLGLGGRARATTTATLVGAATTWSLMWAGVLLRTMGGPPLAFGYFIIWMGVAVVIVGTLMVFLSMRRASAQVSDEASSPEIST